MDNVSVGTGFMAVFAVSGSVALLAHQFNKRLVSQFMEKFEHELVGSNKHQKKKKVRFADDVAEPLANRMYREKHPPSSLEVDDGRTSTLIRVGRVREFETMPLNRQVLYKGIIQCQGLKGQYI